MILSTFSSSTERIPESKVELESQQTIARYFFRVSQKLAFLVYPVIPCLCLFVFRGNETEFLLLVQFRSRQNVAISRGEIDKPMVPWI